jgi:uncharacterized radical SAM protein YgiQ
LSSHLPITLEEVRSRGWHELDIIFVTGDAYIDHPAFGVPLLARWLEAYGFRVGIIPQPDWKSKESFMILGRPRLFFAVTSGAMDSLVAHYTPRKKLRHDDAYTPGGRHGARPNRATIIYTSRLKEAYRDVPVVLGGIEASLRRLAHYDYWEDKVRRSVLLDAKADLLVYGMAEQSLLQVANRMRTGEPLSEIRDVRGTAYVSRDFVPEVIRLPAFETIRTDKDSYLEAFRLAEKEQNPYCGRALVQPHAERLIVCNPPALPLSTAELDALYALPFTREPHPSYTEPVPAFGQINTSLTSHRGCYGGCSFCAITYHQGKFIQSRSVASVAAELQTLAKKTWFRGAVSDLGGPTANMYGTDCAASDGGRKCRRPSCLHPKICPNLRFHDQSAVSLLKKAAAQPGIKTLTVSSGIRHDLLALQPVYFQILVERHVGGLLKVAPEHLVDAVTCMMRKPGKEGFVCFLERFRETSRRLGKRQTVVPYLMSGHPGCSLDDMVLLAKELQQLGLRVEQVQEFTPTPGTAATCMYYTGIDPDSGQAVYVARSDRDKILQKSVLLWHLPEERQRVLKMLRELGRTDLLQLLDAGKAMPERGSYVGRDVRNNRKRTAR